MDSPPLLLHMLPTLQASAPNFSFLDHPLLLPAVEASLQWLDQGDPADLE